MCTCIKLFLQPPLTQCYYCQFYRNLDQLWTIRKKLETKTGTPADPTGSPEHGKNHLDEVQAGSGAVTHQEIYCTVWLMMYSSGQCIETYVKAA